MEGDSRMNLADRVRAARESGEVRRWHTCPQVGDQSVAHHCYGALSLLLLLHPDPVPANLVRAVLWHDAAERWTGDAPYAAKRAFTAFGESLERSEERVQRHLSLYPVDLPEAHLAWLRTVDMLDAWLYAQERAYAGNRYAQDAVDRIERHFRAVWGDLPCEVQDFVADWKFDPLPDRLPLAGEQFIKDKKNGVS